MKYCRVCDLLLNNDNMYESENGICKTCRKEQINGWKGENKEHVTLYNRSYHNEYAKTIKGRYHRLKANAKVRGHEFGLDINSFTKWFYDVDKTCYYCHVALSKSNIKHNKTDLTIDRLDNSKGYFLDNIVLACYRCNIIKGGRFTSSHMLEIASKYLAH